MAIINTPRITLAEVVEFAILVEEELHVRRKNWQDIIQIIQTLTNLKTMMMKVSIMKRRPKKSKKVNIDAIWEGVYCQNCFNEGHFTKECKLLLKFCQMCKASDHNTNHCPSKQ
jgi:hypothetical protein